MTLQAVGESLHIEEAVLKEYEKNGLLQTSQAKNGTSDYPESELPYIAHLYRLQKSGMDLHMLKQFVNILGKSPSMAAEQIRLLRKCRFRLLDEIHVKQQSLDHIDYLIQEIKENKGGIIL